MHSDLVIRELLLAGDDALVSSIAAIALPVELRIQQCDQLEKQHQSIDQCTCLTVSTKPRRRVDGNADPIVVSLKVVGKVPVRILHHAPPTMMLGTA